MTDAGAVVAADLAELVLDRGTFDAVVTHARSDFPFEVCGIIGLHADGRAEVMPIANADRSMRYYVMEPRELLRAHRRLDDEGLGMVIYHSHTHTRAYPSRTDIDRSMLGGEDAYPGALYAIVTLQDDDAPALRAFRIRRGEVTEVPVRIRG